jgi:hypothetical protein
MSVQCLHKIMFGKQKDKGQKKGAIIKWLKFHDLRFIENGICMYVHNFLLKSSEQS